MTFKTQLIVPGLHHQTSGTLHMELLRAKAKDVAARLTDANMEAARAEWEKRLLEHSPEGQWRSGRCSDC